MGQPRLSMIIRAVTSLGFFILGSIKLFLGDSPEELIIAVGYIAIAIYLDPEDKE